jgi:hypothetical protein
VDYRHILHQSSNHYTEILGGERISLTYGRRSGGFRLPILAAVGQEEEEVVVAEEDTQIVGPSRRMTLRREKWRGT